MKFFIEVEIDIDPEDVDHPLIGARVTAKQLKVAIMEKRSIGARDVKVTYEEREESKND